MVIAYLQIYQKSSDYRKKFHGVLQLMIMLSKVGSSRSLIVVEMEFADTPWTDVCRCGVSLQCAGSWDGFFPPSKIGTLDFPAESLLNCHLVFEGARYSYCFLFRCFSYFLFCGFRFVTVNVSPFFEEIMRADRSHKYMVSMMSV